MSYPVANVVLPSSLNGVANGQLDNSILVDAGMVSRPLARLHPHAARAFAAMKAEVAANFGGWELTCTSTADCYRSLAIQISTFQSRYTTTNLPGRPTKRWNGVTYWQKPGTAMAATPGTSNHGLGLAIDMAWYNGEGGVVGITARMDVFNWLLLNAWRFGFSWETQSEPWHVRYVAGDAIPQAVLDHEGGQPAPDPGPAPQPDPGPAPDPGYHGGTPLPTLQKGSSGDQARALIDVLKFWKWYPQQYAGDANDGKIGDRGDAGIRTMQGALGLGVDGQYGPVSAKAYSDFLYNMDAQNNQPDPLAALAAYAADKLARNEAPDHNALGSGELKAGDPRNQDAYLLQVLCNKFAASGSIPGCGNPDGLFGNMTAASFKAFQQVYLGINPGDGKYGPVSHWNLQVLMNNLGNL